MMYPCKSLFTRDDLAFLCFFVSYCQQGGLSWSMGHSLVASLHSLGAVGGAGVTLGAMEALGLSACVSTKVDYHAPSAVDLSPNEGTGVSGRRMTVFSVASP